MELFIILYLTALGMTMGLLFLDSRRSWRRTILVVYVTMAAEMAVVVGVYCTMGGQILIQSYTLVVHVPCLLLFMYFSRHRGWRLVFQMFSSILFCTLIQHGAGLAYYLSGGRSWALLLAYALLTPAVLAFLLLFLRPLVLQTLLALQRGWWLMCVVMGVYYVIIIYLIPGYVGMARSSTILKPAISLLMVGFYSELIILFTSARKEEEARHEAQLSAMRVSALQSRMEGMRAAEDAVRIQRHDLRHYLLTVAELVVRGERQEALTFLETAQRRLNEQKLEHWCRPPVLDAVLASYFSQARRAGIQVEPHIALPEILQVDEGELAMVLANALENAIQACQELPQAERRLYCKMIGSPSFMLEITNPCADTVRFDENGLPMAERAGHGFGSRSIVAFCRKYDAVVEFTQNEGWFTLRLIL